MAIEDPIEDLLLGPLLFGRRAWLHYLKYNNLVANPILAIPLCYLCCRSQIVEPPTLDPRHSLTVLLERLENEQSRAGIGCA